MSTPDLASAPLCVRAQLWLRDYLQSRESLRRGDNQTPIIARREKNLQSDIDAAIDALGACIYVFPMLPLKFNANLPGPVIDLAELRFRCIEDDLLNSDPATGGSKLPDCFELVEAIAREVSGLTMKGIPELSVIYPHPQRPVEAVADERIVHDVVFLVTGGYAPRIEDR